MKATKLYQITCLTDAYNSYKFYEGQAVLRRDGTTPVEWIHDNNCGWGYPLSEARAVLMRYAREDAERSGERITHKYFENFYVSDCCSYRIIPMNEQEQKIDTLEKFAGYINAYFQKEGIEWLPEFDEIIKASGWKDEGCNPGGICSDGISKLEMNEHGFAIVRPIR